MTFKYSSNLYNVNAINLYNANVTHIFVMQSQGEKKKTRGQKKGIEFVYAIVLFFPFLYNNLVPPWWPRVCAQGIHSFWLRGLFVIFFAALMKKRGRGKNQGRRRPSPNRTDFRTGQLGSWPVGGGGSISLPAPGGREKPRIFLRKKWGGGYIKT